MAEHTFLGLSHNPFTAPTQGFYPGGGRKEHLEHLRHLSHWTRRVLLVSGPAGIGKTGLMRELAGSLEPGAERIVVSGTLVHSARELMGTIIQGFSIDAPAAARADLYASMIEAWVDDQEEAGRYSVLLLDDAHLVGPDALEALMALAGKCHLHVVLLAEESLVPDLEQMVDRHSVDFYEIRLAGFSVEDVQAYLEWRFAQARYRGRLPFTSEQVAGITRTSLGLPERINDLADQLLTRMETGEISRSRGRFPTQHKLLLGLLVVLVGLVYLVAQRDESELELATVDVAPTTIGDLEPLELVGSSADSDAQGATMRPKSATPGALASGPGSAKSGTPDEGGTPVPVYPRAAVSTENPGAAVPPQLASAAQNATTASAAGGNTGDNTTNANLSPAKESTTAPLPPPVAPPAPTPARPPAPAAKPAAAPTRQSAAKSAEELRQKAIPVEASVSARGGASSANPAAATLADGAHDASWLLAQRPERYTLQLLTLSSMERVNRFLEKQPEPSEFAVFPMRRGERVLYVIVYGVFSDRAAALRSADNLPKGLSGIKPWVRPVSRVQEAAAAFSG